MSPNVPSQLSGSIPKLRNVALNGKESLLSSPEGAEVSDWGTNAIFEKREEIKCERRSTGPSFGSMLPIKSGFIINKCL